MKLSVNIARVSEKKNTVEVCVCVCVCVLGGGRGCDCVGVGVGVKMHMCKFCTSGLFSDVFVFVSFAILFAGAWNNCTSADSLGFVQVSAALLCPHHAKLVQVIVQKTGKSVCFVFLQVIVCT